MSEKIWNKCKINSFKYYHRKCNPLHFNNYCPTGRRYFSLLTTIARQWPRKATNQQLNRKAIFRFTVWCNVRNSPNKKTGLKDSFQILLWFWMFYHLENVLAIEINENLYMLHPVSVDVNVEESAILTIFFPCVFPTKKMTLYHILSVVESLGKHIIFSCFRPNYGF